MSLTKNLYLVKGESKNFPLQAFNNAGGVIDLSSALITMTVKESTTSTDTEFQRKNAAAGGSTTEIEATSATDGLFLAKLTRTNTLSLDVQAYYYDVTIDTGSDYISHTGSLIVQQSVNDGSTVTKTYGTTAERPTLDTSNVGFMYFDTTIGSAIWWDGSAWV